MKRGREEAAIDVANCLMLLSKVGQKTDDEVAKDSTTGRLFACKTCNRKFSSFQALGGHRASHKKSKLNGVDNLLKLSNSQPKTRTHNCSICGLEFAIGQALGGHMRRHRGGDGLASRALLPVPIMKKCNSSKRVLCLDLNLTPMENYDVAARKGGVLIKL